eukprot:5447830-Amphidinium_carterae.2
MEVRRAERNDEELDGAESAARPVRRRVLRTSGTLKVAEARVTCCDMRLIVITYKFVGGVALRSPCLDVAR